MVPVWFLKVEFYVKKKVQDPVRIAQKNHAYRLGWLIALAGIVAGFIWLGLKA